MNASGVAVDHLLAGTRAGQPLSLAEHLHVHGDLPRLEGAEIIERAAQAGLAGRGGAGFPTARKMAAVARHGGQKVIVANAAESEPMSAKDRVLLELVPHLVLDGLELAVAATGARTTIVAVGSRVAQGAETLARAASERRGPAPKVVRLPSHYLAGQETALINFVAGRALKPANVPPLPVDHGVRGRPTLVQNIETLAHLALIARHGAPWFCDAGTVESPGTILVTIGGAVESPGVYEIRGGSRLEDVIALAGGVRGALRAVLVGGYFGTWFGPDASGLHLDAHSLGRHGASVGTGTLVVLDDYHCPVTEVARVGAWMASQSAGQCGPCTHGLPAIAQELARVASGLGSQHSHTLIQRWGGMVQQRGACHHPDGTARFVLSALDVFRAEFRNHQRKGRCALCSAPPALVIPKALERAA